MSPNACGSDTFATSKLVALVMGEILCRSSCFVLRVVLTEPWWDASSARPVLLELGLCCFPLWSVKLVAGVSWYNVCLKTMRLTQPWLLSEVCIICEELLNLLPYAAASPCEKKLLIHKGMSAVTVKYLRRRADATVNLF